MNENNAIEVADLSKMYKLYDAPIDRLKESLHPLRKKYHRDFYALNDVSFDVKRGETVGIIGRNGSGKSTLLKIISGVLMPTTGGVTVNGKVSALLELGSGFNPELTGIENIYFFGTLQGFTREEMDVRLEKILLFADIGAFVHHPIKIYSSGMLVRLAFAAAINIDPDILIVDEALAVGDIRFQRKCFAKFEDFRKAGKTILFVSHGLDSVNLLCDRAILINDGLILEQGISKYVTRIYQEMMLGVDKSTRKTEQIVGKGHQNDHDLTDHPVNSKEGQAHHMTAAPGDELEKIRQIGAKKITTPNGNKIAEIIDFGILDRFGNRVTILESGGKYTLISRVLIYRDIDHIHIGFPIKNAKGLLLFGVNTAIHHIKIVPQKRGDILEGRVDLTMWLAPGDYFLSFRTFAYDNVYDLVHDAVHFTVMGTSIQSPASIVNLDPQVHVANIN